MIDRLGDRRYAGTHIALDLEVPEPDHPPALSGQGTIRCPVSLLRAGDLRIPVLAALARREVVGVAVPETAVDKDGKLAACEGHVGLSRDVPGVATPTAEPYGVHRSPELQLRLRVLRPNLAHHPTSGLWAEKISHLAAVIADSHTGGASVVFVSRQMGHGSPAITLSTYSHLFDERAHADALSTMLELGYADALRDGLGGPVGFLESGSA